MADDQFPPAQVDAVHAVSAFAGLEVMRAAYAHAIADGYRFYPTATRPAGEPTDGRLSLHHPGDRLQGAHGVLTTTRGEIRTPAFMPVGTAGTVKALNGRPGGRRAGADVLLGNTYT